MDDADDLRLLSDPQLKAEILSTEVSLYRSRTDGSGPERREELERRWNDLKREEARRARRDGKEWGGDKVDRRDDFSVRIEPMPSGRRRVIVEGVYPRESTINWRDDTWYGARIDARVCSNFEKERGHHAGHLLQVSAGIDPDEPNNVVSQHGAMNVREWREMEAARANHANRTNQPVRYQVTSIQRPDPDSPGGFRESGRRARVTTMDGEGVELQGFGHGKGGNDRILDDSKIRYLNPRVASHEGPDRPRAMRAKAETPKQKPPGRTR